MSKLGRAISKLVFASLIVKGVDATLSGAYSIRGGWRQNIAAETVKKQRKIPNLSDIISNPIDTVVCRIPGHLINTKEYVSPELHALIERKIDEYCPSYISKANYRAEMNVLTGDSESFIKFPIYPLIAEACR